ncbi:ABC transporter ATP-binding protein [Rummeliibacillus sp. G93]|uniref:ABC transporter ATP-binding protein n=1 Tax=Rummeliibacillus TaxID=648802 RepID=UPI00116882EE|nr:MULTISPECIES: ABC transporter ATP-binding protein [Rummeliibacillus]MBB5171757.1 acetoin utilization transport system ATP-binding protein [Rummeliibacillus stabekisii]MCM3318177.1 ABC transporter ATP-binding protein [Rummeliibacillus stabekisii]UQW97565.1 ABC transporter ATP-binding protein [Rummeliibacillus sp. G93]GEL06494.1 ABC transporter ATP-binding protein YtrE [Rummeliibacillus stabekisii]
MIQLQHISHTFKIGKKGNERGVPVLKDISFNINDGEIISIVGKSGSGKSTLLNVIAGFLKPETGSIHMNGKETTNFTEAEHAKFRMVNTGFIFQNFQLMPGLTAKENIELPLKIKGVPKQSRKQHVQEILQKVELEKVADHYPNELSGGQQQRVCIARALVTNPPIILADEPTGSLDSETEQEILQLIKQLNVQMGITFVIITHDEEVATIANRTFRMHDGVLKEVETVAI